MVIANNNNLNSANKAILDFKGSFVRLEHITR
jgi:hypothetical protein